MSEEEWRQRKLDKLLEGLKTDPNLASCRSIKRSEPMDGWTPMHAAAFKGNLAVVQALVEWSKQSNSSSTTTNECDTPLHTNSSSSSSNSSSSISTWDLDLQGRTALALAAMEGYYSVVEYLKGVMESEAREGDIVGANAPVDLAGLTPLAWHVKSKVKVKRVVDKRHAYCFALALVKTKDYSSTQTLCLDADAHVALGDPSICPATPVDTRSGSGRIGLSYGYADAPGWRISMEDATCHHTPLPGVCSSIASETGLFGVFDGHGSAWLVLSLLHTIASNAALLSVLLSLATLMQQSLIFVRRTTYRTGGGFTSTFVAQRLLTCLQSTEAWRSAVSSSSVTASVTTSSSSYSSNNSFSSNSSSTSTTAAVTVADQLSPAAVTAALQCAFLAVDALLEVQPRMALHEQDSSEDGKRYKASDSSGSTGIVAAVLPGFVAVANAGDSRAIIVQPQQVQLSSSGRGSVDVSVTALSEDHTALVPAESCRIIAAGGDIEERKWIEDGMERSVLRIKYSTESKGQSVVPSRSFGDFYYKQNSIDGQIADFVVVSTTT
eukprot:17791-Heterococcus_DN1.PRE.1